VLQAKEKEAVAFVSDVSRSSTAFSAAKEVLVSRIFITYRRDDTSSHAGRVYDWLGDHYGSEAVFKDIDSIDPGRPWRKAIDDAVGSADIVIALIGPQWLSELKARDGGPDYVRYELETALNTDRRVIPLLVNGTKMPDPEELPETLAVLSDYQAFDVSDSRFRSDMEELLRRLDRIVQPMTQSETTRSHVHPGPEPEPVLVQEPRGSWPRAQPTTAQPSPTPAVGAATSGQVVAQKAQGLAESLKRDPAATDGAVKVTRLHAPGVDVLHVARTLESWYQTQKLTTQMLDSGSSDRAVIQAQSASWQTAVGMSAALTVVLQREGSDLAVEIGRARWADKGVAAGLSLVVAPLVFTAAWGAWKSFRLPQRTIGIVQSAIASAPRIDAAPSS
jgi:hypothetical protein